LIFFLDHSLLYFIKEITHCHLSIRFGSKLSKRVLYSHQRCEVSSAAQWAMPQVLWALTPRHVPAILSCCEWPKPWLRGHTPRSHFFSSVRNLRFRLSNYLLGLDGVKLTQAVFYMFKWKHSREVISAAIRSCCWSNFLSLMLMTLDWL
jgi:hypothetical protein